MARGIASHVPEIPTGCSATKTRVQVAIPTGFTALEKIASSSAAGARADSFANPSHRLSMRNYKTAVFTSHESREIFQNFL
jgi:hypothetical protein